MSDLTSFDRHPVIRILSIPPPISVDLSTVPSLISAFKSAQDIALSKEDLAKIYELINKGVLLGDIQKAYKIGAGLNLDCLQCLQQLNLSEVKDSNVLQICEYVILHATLSFILQSQQKFDSPTFVLLLELLMNLRKSAQFPMIVDTIILLLIDFEHKLERPTIQQTFQPISSIFKLRTIPSETLSMLTKMFLRLSHRPTEAEGLSDLLYLLNALIDTMLNLPDKQLISNVSSNVFNVLIEYAQKMDDTAINGLSQIVQFAKPESLQSFCEQFPTQLSNYILNHEVFLRFETVPDLPPPVSVTFSKTEPFQKKLLVTFQEGAPFELLNLFNKIKTVSDTFPAPLQNLMKCMNHTLKAASFATSKFTSQCLEILTQNASNEHYLELVVAIVNMTSDLELETFIMKSSLFDPSITVYTTDERLYPYFTARAAFINGLTNIATLIEVLIKSKVQYPLFIAEIFHYCNDSLSNFSPAYLNSEPFIKLICELIGFYQVADIESEEHKREIEFARISMLTFVCTLIHLPDYFSWQYNERFNDMFLAQLYEPKIRPFLLSNLLKIWMNNDNIDYQKIICPFFQDAIEHQFDVQMAADMLEILNQLFAFKDEFLSVFHFMKLLIAKRISSVDDNEKFFLEYIKFVSISSYTNTIDLNVDEISSKLNPSLPVFKSLMSFLMGNDFESLKPRTVMRYPNVLLIILKIFARTSLGMDFMAFLTEACDYSVINIYACHNVGLDDYLVDLLAEEKHFSPLYDQVAQLFIKIAMKATTSKVSQKFFDLMDPKAPTYDYLLACLSDLILVSHRKTYLPINENKKPVIIPDLKPVYFNNGFTIAINLFSGRIPTLLTIGTAEGVRINFSINNNTLYARNQPTKITVPTDSWYFLALTFRKEKSGRNFVHIIPTINTKTYEEEMITIPWESFQSSQKVILTLSHPDKVFTTACMGEFGLYPLLTPEQLLQMAREATCSTEFNPIFIATQSIEEGVLKMSITDKFAISYDTEITLPLSFPMVMAHYNQICLLFLHLRALDVSAQQNLPTSASRIVDLIVAILSINEHVQKFFVMANACSMAASIFMKLSNKHVTRGIYMQFYTLFKQVNYVPLKKSLMTDFLLNFEVWIRSSPEDQAYISRHWSRTLFSETKDLFFELFTFDSILMAMNYFYWYKPLDTDIWKEREPNLNVKEIRQNLLNLLHQIAINSFTVTDLFDLIGHCVLTRDLKQCFDLISMIKLLLVCPESPFEPLKESLQIMSALHLLLNSENEPIVLNVIETLATTHFLGLIEKPKPHHHVYVLMKVISLAVYTDQFFTRLVALTMKYHIFLPLCFSLATRVPSARPILIEHLSPNTEYASNKHWSLLPIISAFAAGGEFYEYVFHFLAASTPDKWDEVFTNIEIVAQAFNVDAEPAKRIFIYDISQFVIENPKTIGFELLHLFLDIATHFIFFRRKGNMNPLLKKGIKTSHFKDTLPPDPDTEELPITMDNFFHIIKQQRFTKPEYVYGLNFDENHHWADYELGLNLIMIAKKTSNETFHNIAALILSIARREHLAEIQEYVDYFISQEIAEKSFIGYLKQDRTVKPTCFDYFLQEREAKCAAFALEFMLQIRKFLIYHNKSEAEMGKVFDQGDDNLCDKTQKRMFQYGRYLAEKKMKFSYFDEQEEKPYITYENSFNFGSVPMKYKRSNKQPNNEISPDPAELHDLVISHDVIIPCELISFSNSIKTRLSVYNGELQFVHEGGVFGFVPDEVRSVARISNHSFELFLKNRKVYLVNLTIHTTESVLTYIYKIPGWDFIHPNGQIIVGGAEWGRARESNFQFVMHLNIAAGRSFNNKNIYPVLPDVNQPENITATLPPEDFTMPEFVKDKIGEQNPFEYVYNNRKKLESEEVSRNIDKWIKEIIGIPVIPRYNFYDTTVSLPQVFTLSVDKRLTKFAAVTKKSETEIQFDCIDSKLSVYRYTITVANSKPVASLKETGIKIAPSGPQFYHPAKNAIAVVSKTAVTMYNFATLKYTIFDNHCQPIKCVAADQLYFLTGSADSTINMIANDQLVRVYQPYKGEIVSLDISSGFSAIVAATEDGNVWIFSTLSDKVKHVIKHQEHKPEHVIITKSWGFIVVISHRYMSLYSINGEYIKSIEFTFTIKCWHKFISNDGFDYLIISDNEGNIYIFEVFPMEIGQPVFKCDSKVVKVHYDVKLNLALVVTEDSNFHLVPHQINKPINK